MMHLRMHFSHPWKTGVMAWAPIGLVLIAWPTSLMAKDWLRDVEAAYTQMGGVAARFAQTTSQPAFGRTVTAEGELVFAHGKMRWDYSYPDQQTYIVTPSDVLLVQPSERQVVRIKIDEAFASGAPAALLGGMARISQYFRQVAAAQSGPMVRLKLVPRADDPQVVQVVADWDSRARVVVRIETTDAFGNVNAVALADIVRQPVPPSRFEFRIPSGWSVWPADPNSRN
jgi:outer membrane lipoprotein-sorting protein